MKKKIFWFIGGLAIIAAAVMIYFFLLQRKNTGALYAIPDNAMAVCSFSNAPEVFSEWERSATQNAFRTLPEWNSLVENVQSYILLAAQNPGLEQDLREQELVTALFSGGKDALSWLFVVTLDNARDLDAAQLAGMPGDAVAHTFEHEQVYEYRSDSTQFACAKVYGLFIFSTSTVLVENAILHVKKQPSLDADPAFHSVHTALGDPAPFHIMLHYPVCVDYLSAICKKDKYALISKMKGFTDWIGFSLVFSPQGVQLSGFSAASADGRMRALSGNYAHTLPSVIPQNTIYIDRIQSAGFTVQTAKLFSEEESNRAFFDHWAPWMSDVMLVGMTEPLDQAFEQNMFVLFPVSDTKLVYDKLSVYSIQDSLVRDHSVWKMYGGNMLRKISHVPFSDTLFAGVIDNYLVFAPVASVIEEMQTEHASGERSGGPASYAGFEQHVSSNFNRSWYMDMAHANQLVKYILPEDSSNVAPFTARFKQMELQITANKDIYLFNGFIQYSEETTRTSGMVWKQKLDRPARNGPFVVYDGERRQMFIALQDTANQMMMYSANGALQWKQFLPGKIMGEVQEVDFYGNGSTQLLFNTADAIYLMDFAGNMVEGFPITLTSFATAPLCVDDLSKGKYNMYIPCANDNIYGFSSDGRPLTGWNPFKGSGTVSIPMRTLFSGGETYIEFVSGGTLHVVKQNGKVAKRITFDEPVIDAMTALSTSLYLGVSGTVYILDTDWNLRKIPPFVSDLHPAFADVDGDGEPDILYSDGNYLKAVKTNNETIFVADVMDTASSAVAQRVYNMFGYGALSENGNLYLLDQNGKVRDGFPRHGSGMFKLCDLTLNGDTIVVVLDGKTLYAYRLK